MKKIRQLIRVGEDHTYQFLGFALNLETNQLHDKFHKDIIYNDWFVQTITLLLAHYSLVNDVAKKGKLVKFKDLSGGYAYERAFTQKGVDPIAQAFGNVTVELVETAKLFSGKQLNYWDMSVEILNWRE